jgi:hypothetical protein
MEEKTQVMAQEKDENECGMHGNRAVFKQWKTCKLERRDKQKELSIKIPPEANRQNSKCLRMIDRMTILWFVN